MAGPMSTPGDLASMAGADGDGADAESAAEDQGEQGDQGQPQDVEVCLKITPDGKISVYDTGGLVQPQQVGSLEEGLKALGELATELSRRFAVKAMKAKQMARPGNADAQSIWDQMAAQRPQRGNT